MDSDSGRRFMGNDNSDPPEVSEDAFRQALERLGSRGKRAGQSGNSRTHQTHTENRRRRFVQDGEVVVEHHAASRGPAVRQPPAAAEDQAEIERLKTSVKREQRRVEDTQRLLHESQTQTRSAETRAAHAEIRVKEMQDLVRERDQRIADLMAQVREQAALLEASREAARDAARHVSRTATRDESPLAPPRPRGRPAKVSAVAALADDAMDDGPQPVKWWTGD